MKRIKRALATFGFFYYSKKQDGVTMYPLQNKTYAMPLFGKTPVMYSEQVSTFPFRPIGSWDDYKLVCIGFVDHAE